jgi:hypothetical protein
MPDGCHHDPHIEGKLIGAGLCKEIALEEHAGSLAELDNRAGHAFGPEGKMGGSIQRNFIKRVYMANFMRALGAGILAGHDIAAQIDGDSIFAVHTAFLAKGFDWSASLDGGVEFVKARAKAKGVWILDQRLKD